MPVQYWEKMYHDVPDAPVMNRAEYLVKAATGKRILDIGGTGPMADKLREVASEYWSLDKEPSDRSNHIQVDLDHAASVYDFLNWEDFDLVIAGEVIEHLSNPGNFLDALTVGMCPVILTVPNCGTSPYRPGQRKEVVNGEHVAWYSYHTLKTLVERHGFRVLLWCWYNGKPFTAEGLIFHMEPTNG